MADKEKTEVEMTEEEKKSILEDLVFKGKVEREYEILDGLMKVTFKSISGQEQIDLEKKARTDRLTVHEYSIEYLAKALKIIVNKKGKEFDMEAMEIEQARTFISDMPTSLLDTIIEKHREFNLKLKASTQGEEIEKGLFKTNST